MSLSDAERVDDIRTAIARCIDLRDHLDSPELGAMAYDAILRNLAVIGEAVRSLPEDFKQAHAGTPWPSIAGLRNVVVHAYMSPRTAQDGTKARTGLAFEPKTDLDSGMQAMKKSLDESGELR